MDYVMAMVPKIKVALVSKFPKNVGWVEPNWYKSFRQSIEKECLRRGLIRVKTGAKLSVDDLEELCIYLVKTNDESSYRDRTLLVLLWQAIGRILEVATMKYDELGLTDSKKYIYF
jgi:hypothetical protein